MIGMFLAVVRVWFTSANGDTANTDAIAVFHREGANASLPLLAGFALAS